MKYLFIGDPHVVKSELDDCWVLIKQIKDTFVNKKCDRMVFLGDLFHNHELVNLKVQNFWFQAFTYLLGVAKKDQIIALVGNHDQPGPGDESCHSLEPFKSLITVIDEPQVIDSNLFLSYFNDKEKFVKVCNDYENAKLLICHQTFDGAKFENGFYAPNGISLDAIPQTDVISGHIHCKSVVGKLCYPGSPRWRSMSDANQGKALLIVDLNNSEVDWVGSGCQQILKYDIVEGSPLPVMGEGKVSVDIKGSSNFIKEILGKLPKGIKTRTFSTDDQKTVKVKESEGLQVAFKKFINDYMPKYGTDKQTLMDEVLKRLNG